jgi:succinate dehydrogenase / fumarate reductase cytochrome b subunit
MILSGLTLLAFIIYHLLHFTVRVGNDYATYKTSLHGETVHDVYRMVIAGFSWWPASLFYIIAMCLLWSHLSHGVQSMFQTVGLSNERTIPIYKTIALVFATVILIGNCSIPISVMLGWVK